MDMGLVALHAPRVGYLGQLGVRRPFFQGRELSKRATRYPRVPRSRYPGAGAGGAGGGGTMALGNTQRQRPSFYAFNLLFIRFVAWFHAWFVGSRADLD